MGIMDFILVLAMYFMPGTIVGVHYPEDEKRRILSLYSKGYTYSEIVSRCLSADPCSTVTCKGVSRVINRSIKRGYYKSKAKERTGPRLPEPALKAMMDLDPRVTAKPDATSRELQMPASLHGMGRHAKTVQKRGQQNQTLDESESDLDESNEWNNGINTIHAPPTAHSPIKRSPSQSPVPDDHEQQDVDCGYISHPEYRPPRPDPIPPAMFVKAEALGNRLEGLVSHMNNPELRMPEDLPDNTNALLKYLIGSVQNNTRVTQEGIGQLRAEMAALTNALLTQRNPYPNSNPSVPISVPAPVEQESLTPRPVATSSPKPATSHAKSPFPTLSQLLQPPAPILPQPPPLLPHYNTFSFCTPFLTEVQEWNLFIESKGSRANFMYKIIEKIFVQDELKNNTISGPTSKVLREGINYVSRVEGSLDPIRIRYAMDLCISRFPFDPSKDDNLKKLEQSVKNNVNTRLRRRYCRSDNIASAISPAPTPPQPTIKVEIDENLDITGNFLRDLNNLVQNIH